MEFIPASAYAQASADDALRKAKQIEKDQEAKRKVFKEHHLVDDLNRGAKTDSCKVCGVKITNLQTHLKWHNQIGV